MTHETQAEGAEGIDRRSIVVVTAARPGVAAVWRVIRSSGAWRSSKGRTRWRFLFPQSATSQWYGWYSSRIVDNGWQPYDQPHPAAYIPHGYDRFTKLDLPEGMAVRQVAPDVLTALTVSRGDVVVCAESELAGVVSETLRTAAVPEDYVDLAWRFFASGALGSAGNAA
jgi:hypothetical protein